MKLEGKVAIVTGATSGMGRATAVLFAKEGAKVVVTGRNEERAQAVVDEIKANGGEAIHTAMVDSIGGPSVLQGMIDNCPCKRVGQPEDIAGAALFLASDDCTFLTGQIIKVDGGFEC